MEVEGDHTYFVGGAGWGFSLWAHNADGCRMDKNGRWHDEKGKFAKAPTLTHGAIGFSPMRQMHVIYGGVPKAGGGGHSYRARVGAGVPGVVKSRFPKSVSDAKIVEGISRIANDPASYAHLGITTIPVAKKPGSRYEAQGTIAGIATKVIVEPHPQGQGVITGHPL